MTENSGITVGDNSQLTGVAGGDFSGNVNLNSLLSSPKKSEIKELLRQLQETIDSEPLSDIDKNDATEEIANLQTAVATPEENERKTKAAKAIRMLTRIGATLPPTAALFTILE